MDYYDMKDALTKLFDLNTRPIGERMVLYGVEFRPLDVGETDYHYALTGIDPRNIGEIGTQIKKSINNSGIIKEILETGRTMNNISVTVSKKLHRPEGNISMDEVTEEQVKNYRLEDETFVRVMVDGVPSVGTDLKLLATLGNEIYNDLKNEGYTSHKSFFGTRDLESGLCDFEGGSMYLGEEMKGLGL